MMKEHIDYQTIQLYLAQVEDLSSLFFGEMENFIGHKTLILV